MAAPKLLSNLPINELTKETDYLGVIDKGDLIKSFLIGNKDQFNEIKMFSLYGEWGSGKSSLMKYLEKELKGDFNTFFFEAWEFEKDDNLAMSLLEFINSKNVETGEQFCNDLLKYGGRILRGLGRSVKLNIPLFTNGSAVEINPSALVEEVAKTEELTFYKALESFKVEFVKFEDRITGGSSPRFNVVFIDDLDRCEPEQVLNLLSAIKLFFTYGKKTIFLCGIDKEAVEQAVKTKYGEVVKSNEYLEKIFDISLSMPDHNDLLKLINHYFDSTIYELGDERKAMNIRINEFFNTLKFTNPRRVKKVLNKFQFMRSLKLVELPEKFLPFPNIDLKDGTVQNYFETVLVLYLIILHEFYSELFENFCNFNFKRKSYYLGVKASDFSGNNESSIRATLNIYMDNNYSDVKFNELEFSTENNGYFNICISPIMVEQISQGAIDHRNETNKLVAKHIIEFLFYDLVITTYMFHKSKNKSQVTFNSVKKLIKNAL